MPASVSSANATFSFRAGAESASSKNGRLSINPATVYCRGLRFLVNLMRAAIQRNESAADVKTPLAAFTDDDVVLQPDTFAYAVWALRKRSENWWYRRPQLRSRTSRPFRGSLVVLSVPSSMGRVVGPVINNLPCNEEALDLIPSEWLNSTCVAYRTGAASERFPELEGYRFMKEVHPSTRIAKKWKLYFHSQSIYEHRSQPSVFKKDIRVLTARRFGNQRLAVLKGIAIGGDTGVGAGSIVTKSLPPHVITIGSPAKILQPL